MNLKRRLGIVFLCVLLPSVARADEPAAAQAPPTAPPPPKRQVVEVPLSTLDSYVGRYKLPPDSEAGDVTLALFRERGHLLAQFTEVATAYEVLPATPVRFFCKPWEAELTFEKDGDGHVTGMTFEINGKKSLAKKISNDPQVDGPGPTDAGDLASTKLLSRRLAALASQLKSGDKSALDRFWQELQGKGPLIEPIADDPKHSWVTFMWRGNSKTWRVHLRGFHSPNDTNDAKLTLLPGTDLWYRTERIPNDARFAYIFRINCDEAGPDAYAGQAQDAPLLVSHLDPLNPREATIGPLLSLLEMPAAPPEPWRKRLAGVPAGTLTEKTIESTILKERRKFTVYTPATYDPKGPPLRLLVLFDGSANFDGDDLVPGHVILDNLIAKGKIPPVMAVFVDQKDRAKELNCSNNFADYVALELVPKVRKDFRVTEDPAGTIVGGQSLGGLMSSYCALRHSGVFGNVLSQSGAYWWFPEHDAEKPWGGEPGWLTREYVTSPSHPVRFYLEDGCFEGDIAENHRFRDVLQAKGYQVRYHKFSGSHDYQGWRASFAD